MPTEIEPCFYKHFTGCDGEINTNGYTTIISEFCSDLTVIPCKMFIETRYNFRRHCRSVDLNETSYRKMSTYQRTYRRQHFVNSTLDTNTTLKVVAKR